MKIVREIKTNKVNVCHAKDGVLVAARSEGTGWCWENLLDEILKCFLT